MSQPELGDGENPRPPSEENDETSSEQTPEPKRVGLPWQFWLWQSMPMVFLILWMPPGENTGWWLHKPVIDWIFEQPWGGLLCVLILMTWFCQGILLAFWMIWGNRFWGYRIFKVLGLGALAALLPEIWFNRHFTLSSEPNPWSEVFNPIALSLFLLWAVVCSFLPAVIVMGTLYWRGYRMTAVELPAPPLKRWQFSLWGLTVLTFVCSVVLAFFNWFYSAMMMREWFRAAQNTNSEWDFVIGLAASSALSSLLAGVILIWRKWQVTAMVFGFLTVLYLLGIVPMSLHLFGEKYYRWSGPIFVTVGLALGNMISLAISRYWIGWHRFKLIRLSKQASPQET